MVFGVSLRLLFVAQGQVAFLYPASYPRKVLKRVFLFMPDIRNGLPFPRILGGRECWEWHTKTATCSHQQHCNKRPGTKNLETKHDVRSQSRYLYVLHSCRPSTRSAPSRVPPRCYSIQIIPTSHYVYQALGIHTWKGTAVQLSLIHI